MGFILTKFLENSKLLFKLKLIVFIEEMACSACPPAFVYSYFYFFARPWTLVINKNALMDKRGIKAKRARAKSHPFTNARIIPDKQTETV